MVQSSEKILKFAEKIIPDLGSEAYKGQCGRIGIIGGCLQYTGAPYFSSISSLKLGSDLVFVFCSSTAAIPIKSYSPELIVIPILDSINVETSLPRYLSGLHALVIGPGLGNLVKVCQTLPLIMLICFAGKDDSMSKVVFTAIEVMKQSNKPILLDADSLHFVGKNLNMIKNYSNAILTPNLIEFSRLYRTIFGRDLNKDEMLSPGERLKEVSKEMGPMTIVVKGKNDLITDGKNLITCNEEGSSRRCGGQGDLLVGSMANFAYWSNLTAKNNSSIIENCDLNPLMVAAFAACVLTRKCNRLAFDKFGRCMTTSDMIKELPKVFSTLFPSKHK